MTDTGTSYTFEFVRRALPLGSSRILEIGCGTGELAAALTAVGMQVVALDMNDEAVAQARSRGIDARLAEWPDFDADAFDAVLFTRSLHHMHELDRSVEAAFAALRIGGRIIVEDFRAEGAGHRTESWFRSLVGMLHRSDLIVELTPHLRTVLGEVEEHDHDHELHSSSAIEEALKRGGVLVSAEDAAYLFRYLLPAVGDTLGAALLQHELELIGERLIDPLGRRHVAGRI